MSSQRFIGIAIALLSGSMSPMLCAAPAVLGNSLNSIISDKGVSNVRGAMPTACLSLTPLPASAIGNGTSTHHPLDYLQLTAARFFAADLMGPVSQHVSPSLTVSQIGLVHTFF